MDYQDVFWMCYAAAFIVIAFMQLAVPRRGQ